MSNYININTQETEIPNTVGAAKGVTWDNSQDVLKDLGWRIKPELPPTLEGFERLSVTYTEGDGTTAQAIYTDTLIQDRLDVEESERVALAEQQAAQNIIDEQNKQLKKSDDLKKAENEYILFCDLVTGSNNHVALGIPELEAIGVSITDELTALKLQLALLKINAKCVLYGGVKWWDTCTWHPEVVNS